ncbi:MULTISPECIES: Jag family protein [unclassified Gordonia (in: high G+C Gram-positive bacteria)]|uniref:Jag family protein n=1 Tax=unclassified Gordonia (in: high G+C Gram-positive bacteria) TaxID=2657482 RepID=UPI00071C9F66|nr:MULTISPECIES: R3H domain-containing nucleic acid-binding protein [unclassified Gordonia (in: high G+C Gram-positive bacteria)]KSU56511.1 single-stranded DNA-binding protein [Gordonia sp. SGD-V-85]SCC48215.1 spoIIIJ-associated protein [Gordonia sp. v-85]
MTAETATQAGTDAETTAGPQTEDQADTSSSAVGDDGAVADNAVTEAADSDADEDEADATDVDDETDDDDSDEDEDDEDRLVEEGEIAGDYLEQLLDVLDFDGDIDLDVDGDRAVVSIDGGDDLTKLVGRKGEVLDALQELTRLAVQQATGERSRLMLDIARWRADRRDRLARLGREVAERVLSSGEREALDPMTPFERKIVHDAVAVVDGVVSESEGAEPKRRVVVLPS